METAEGKWGSGERDECRRRCDRSKAGSYRTGQGLESDTCTVQPTFFTSSLLLRLCPIGCKCECKDIYLILPKFLNLPLFVKLIWENISEGNIEHFTPLETT